jgi:hypothetical protein
VLELDDGVRCLAGHVVDRVLVAEPVGPWSKKTRLAIQCFTA